MSRTLGGSQELLAWGLSFFGTPNPSARARLSAPFDSSASGPIAMRGVACASQTKVKAKSYVAWCSAAHVRL